jgi:type IV pilus assembly protein PilA
LGNYITRRRETDSRKEKDMLHWFARRMKEMQEVRRDERGFTLIELLIVIIIIAILAAIALPTFLAQRDKANAAACRSDTRNAAEAAVLFASDNDGSFATMTEADLAAQGFNQTQDPPITTTVVIEGGGTGVTLNSDCPPGVSDASWSTVNAPTGVVTGGEDIP